MCGCCRPPGTGVTGHVGAGSAPVAPHRPERETHEAAPRDEREGHRVSVPAAGADLEQRSSSEPGTGASSRHCRRKSSIAAAQPLARARARKAERNTRRCEITGTNSCSTSSGTTYSRPWSNAHPRCAVEGEAPSHRGSHRHVVEHSRRAHELDEPALDDVVDVDVLDGGAEHGDVREAHGQLEAVQRMDDALLVEDRQLVLDPDSRARS